MHWLYEIKINICYNYFSAKSSQNNPENYFLDKVRFLLTPCLGPAVTAAGDSSKGKKRL